MLWKQKIITPQSSSVGQTKGWLYFNSEFDVRVFHDTEGDWDHSEVTFLPQDRISIFRHKGKFFLVARSGVQKTEITLKNSGDKTRTLTLWCLGQSTKPIEALLKEAADTFVDEVDNRSTLVCVNKQSTSWEFGCVKARRALDTVDLQPGLKESFVHDVEQFLSPTRRAYYKRQGIPHRRGYLFHGPPGTGKSSLAFALAGKFGLKIYCASLLDPTLKDSELAILFSNMDSRSLLLLEDIHSAGLGRETLAKESATPDKTTDAAQTGQNSQATPASHVRKSNVTLAGLLNAIDGVASPEGHILIMTSNKPEKLDYALTRAGRVSMNVGFTLATGAQVENIYLRMYSKEDGTCENRVDQGIVSKAELKILARKFGSQVPEGLLSPADIQEFIIVRSDEPQRAVNEIEQLVATKRKEQTDLKSASAGKPAGGFFNTTSMLSRKMITLTWWLRQAGLSSSAPELAL